MAKGKVRRSGLTMPVNTARFVDAAWRRGCDFINLDLEDSVPEWQKPHRPHPGQRCPRHGL